MRFRHRTASKLTRTFNRGPKETFNSFQRPSHVMRHGFTGTTQKPSKKSERAHYLHIQKNIRHVCSNERGESLLLQTHTHTHKKNSHSHALCIFTQVQSINQYHYTNILKNMLHMWNSGSSIVQFSTMKMHLLIQLCLCRNFWPKTKCHSTPSLLIRFFAT